MRYALGLEYDGAGFYGWQTQRQSPTVQQTLETALTTVADEDVSVVAAGRTDTGVHATGQVVHFDSDAERSERSWILGINSHLPAGISVHWVRPVPTEFHARFSALSRAYRYSILNRWIRPALGRRTVAWVRQPLDESRMHEAVQALLGEHDFSAFRAAGCQSRHAWREVRTASVTRAGNRVDFDIEANAFVYHMVRNIAGSLLSVGKGEKSVAWLQEVLQAGDRTRAGITAPAAGLCFTGVRYPSAMNLPVYDIDDGWHDQRGAST